MVPSRILNIISAAHCLALVWRRLLLNGRILRPLPLLLTVDGSRNVEQPHHASNDGVRDDELLFWRVEVDLLRQLQTKPAVDDAERDHDAADPDMCVGPKHPSRVLLESEVMDEPQERLDQDEHEADHADDRMVVVELVDVSRHPDAQGESADVDDRCNDLEEAVDEPQATEGSYTDQDAAEWEKDAECHCCADCVCCDFRLGADWWTEA